MSSLTRSFFAVFALFFSLIILSGCGGGSSSSATTPVATSPNLIVSALGEDLSDQGTLCSTGEMKYSNPHVGIAADDFSLRVTIANTGTGVASGVNLSVSLPSGITYTGPTMISSTQVTDITSGLSVGNITSNGSVTVEFLVRVSGTLDEGDKLTTSISITSSNSSTQTASLITNVSEPAVLCRM